MSRAAEPGARFGRGLCSTCPYSWRLLRGGEIQHHWLYSGTERKRCEGSNKMPRPAPPEGRNRSKGPLARGGDRG